jgi:hypothetical protein
MSIVNAPNTILTQLLSNEDICVLEKELQSGYYDTNKLTKYIVDNCKLDDYTLIDVDTIIIFDLHTNESIFVTENEIYTKKELIDKFNINMFEIEPEILFELQYIEVIGADYFISNKGLPTKIYIGKEAWKDFVVSFRFMRSMSFISKNKKMIKSNDNINII